MLKTTFALLVSCCLIFVYSCKSSTEKDSIEVAEEKNEEKFGDAVQNEIDFIVDAASEGLMEVELGKIAQQNGVSPKVKEFGANMVNDHSKVQEQLKELATSKNISIPVAPGEKHQRRVEKLSKLQGDNFDKEYIKLMVEDHQEELDRFHKIATEGKDPETKAFAAGQLEALQQHLNMAKAIQNTIK